MKISVAVLFGGKSVEHEVSIISAVQAMAAMDESRYEVIPVYITKGNEMMTGPHLREIDSYKDLPGLIRRATKVHFDVDGDKTYLTAGTGLFAKKSRRLVDVAFPIVHGTNVEDGALQGFLETANLPYVGPNVLSSAVCMDKHTMKVMLNHAGLPVLNGLKFSRSELESAPQTVEREFSYPVIVKPVNLGSSVGVGKANNAEELRECMETASAFSRHILIEPAVVNLREINCSVVGDSRSAEASECEEPVMTDRILSYADKYESQGKSGSPKSGMASLTRKIPAGITAEQRERIRTLAVDAFTCLDCSGVARVDFLMDSQSGEIWINELNTIPGSLSFYLWEPVGVPYPELLDRLISLALARQREADDLTYTFDTNILAGASLGATGSKGGAKLRQ